MLATNCPQCYTIELQDKQGQLYCVACQEVTFKDLFFLLPFLPFLLKFIGLANDAFRQLDFFPFYQISLHPKLNIFSRFLGPQYKPYKVIFLKSHMCIKIKPPPPYLLWLGPYVTKIMLFLRGLN